MKRKIWHFGIVTALFLLSLLPRVKNIQTRDYPTVIPHLQILQTIRVWDDVGASTHAFLPIQTWSNPNDKFITYFPRLENAQGDNYYVSYPPFAFTLAWAFCKVFGLPFSVLSITILNLLLQWIAAWCVFAIVRRLLPSQNDQKIYWPGIAAAAVFICNPASMRIFSQVYFSESVGTALLCIFTYFAVCVSQNPASKRNLFGLGLFLFLLTYTEWVGIFAGLCFGIFWGIKSIKNASFRWPFFITCLSVIAGILLFAYQLDVITGSGDFIANIKERYLARSGMRDKEKSVGDTVFKDGLLEWFLSTFKVTMYAARWFVPCLLLVALIYFKRKKAEISASSYTLFWVIFFMVLINFLALFNFSIMHSYTWVKWGLPLALVVAWCVHILMREGIMKIIVPVCMVAFFVTDLIFYHGFSSKDTAPKYWEELTEYIKQEAKPDETIYITTVSEEIDPAFYLTYYTGRNMMNVQSLEEAQKHAAKIGRSKYVWFNFNQMEGKKEIHRFGFYQRRLTKN